MTRGWQAFLTVWSGQTVSALGSRLTAFALSVWVYERTGSVTLFGLIVALQAVPAVFTAPLAGALVDRWDRRRVMVLSDTGAALGTLAIALLLFTDRLEPWHLGIILGFGSVCEGFQRPAYFASIPLLVDKAQLGRTSGLMQLSQAGGRILAPALAGLLIETVGTWAVLAIDFLTFLAALATLALVRLPAPPGAAAAPRPGLWREVRHGWVTIRERPGLTGLIGFTVGGSFFMSMLEVLLLPMILAVAAVGTAGLISSTIGFGMLAGGIGMSIWGGPRRRAYGVLGFSLLLALALILAGARPEVLVIGGALLLFAVSMPIVEGCNQVLWQTKVPPAVQGRAFALRNFFARLVTPIGMLLAGPLADRVFEPLMAPGGALAPTLGRLIGTGEGRGMALMLILMGTLAALLIAWAATSRPFRHLDDLPDALDEPPRPAGAPSPPAAV